MDFNMLSFNCKGLKFSYDFIDNYRNSENCDIMFVCKHSLTAQERASFKQRFNGDNHGLT